MNQKPSIGRTVNFVLDGQFSPGQALRDGTKGQFRPAVIVRTWPKTETEVHDYVNLVVTLDGMNDQPAAAPLHMWRSSVPYDPNGAPGTWHWPARI